MHMNEFLDICCEKGGFDRTFLEFPDTPEGNKYKNIVISAFVRLLHAVTYNGLVWHVMGYPGSPDSKLNGPIRWELYVNRVGTADLIHVPKEVDLKQL